MKVFHLGEIYVHLFDENGKSLCGFTTAPKNMLKKGDNEIRCNKCRGVLKNSKPINLIKPMQVVSRKKPLKINWSKIHPDVRYLAMDSEGDWIGFQHKPQYLDGFWIDNVSAYIYPLKKMGGYRGHPKNSLVKRARTQKGV